jgi:hypothetical protein
MKTPLKGNFGDFEMIPAITGKSAGTFGNNELTFAFPEVLEVIQLCSANQVRDDQLYQTEQLSAYDLSIGADPATSEQWPEYVAKNNGHAEEFIRQRPAGDDHVYVLTTSSWRELEKVKLLKKKR